MDATILKISNIKDLRVTKKEIINKEPYPIKIPISQNYVTLERCSTEKGNLFWDEDFINLNADENIKIETEMCRVCIKQGTIPIHGKGPGKDFASALRTLADIDVKIFDLYPKYLCESCHSLLQSAILLRKTAKSSERLLKTTMLRLPIADNISDARDTDNKAQNIKTKSNMLDDNDDNSDYRSDTDVDETPENVNETPDDNNDYSDYRSDTDVDETPENVNETPDDNDDNSDYRSDTDVDETPGNINETPNILEPQIYVQIDNAHYSFTKPTQPDPFILIDKTTIEDTSSVKEHEECDFTCKKCDVKFDTFQEYRLHKLSLIKHKKRECSKCMQRTAVRYIKITNKTTKKAECSFVCEICYGNADKVIDEPEANNYDLGEVKKSEKKQKDKKEGKGVLDCKLCLIEFDTFEEYVEHKHTGMHKRNICGVCNKKIAVRYVKKYLKIDNKKGLYTCNACYLKESITIVKGLTLENLSREKVVKQKSKLKFEKINCEICNKAYSKRGMSDHMLQHKLPTFVCETCGKQFKLRSHLVNHTAIHTNNLPYKCSICPYRTQLKNSLKMHKRSHTGERPYHCQECPQQFISKSNLNRHTLTHKKRDFPCDCGGAFYTKRELDMHFKVDHLGIKDHSCDICGKRFGYSKILARHKRQVHKAEKRRNGRMPIYLKIQNASNV